MYDHCSRIGGILINNGYLHFQVNQRNNIGNILYGSALPIIGYVLYGYSEYGKSTLTITGFNCMDTPNVVNQHLRSLFMYRRNNIVNEVL